MNNTNDAESDEDDDMSLEVNLQTSLPSLQWSLTCDLATGSILTCCYAVEAMLDDLLKLSVISIIFFRYQLQISHDRFPAHVFGLKTWQNRHYIPKWLFSDKK